jgi:hypothetical protein
MKVSVSQNVPLDFIKKFITIKKHFNDLLNKKPILDYGEQVGVGQIVELESVQLGEELPLREEVEGGVGGGGGGGVGAAVRVKVPNGELR